jgi:hypothetical protein
VRALTQRQRRDQHRRKDEGPPLERHDKTSTAPVFASVLVRK